MEPPEYRPPSPAPSVASPASARGRLWQGWPGLCALCDQAGSGWLCAECEARHTRLRPRCRRCALPTAVTLAECGECIANPPPFDAVVCAVDYVFPWPEVVLALKRGDGLDAARHMAARMLAAANAAGLLPSVHAFVPVPLSEKRLRERGHNQAAVLARALASQSGRTCLPHALWRVADTQPQAGLPRAERLRNLDNAFAPAPRAALSGRCIALVDDVVTTTATARAAAAALKRGGAAKVQVWAFARTPAPHEQ